MIIGNKETRQIRDVTGKEGTMKTSQRKGVIRQKKKNIPSVNRTRKITKQTPKEKIDLMRYTVKMKINFKLMM